MRVALFVGPQPAIATQHHLTAFGYIFQGFLFTAFPLLVLRYRHHGCKFHSAVSVLALDNIAKAVPAGGKQLKPVRFVNGEPVFRFRVEAIRCGNYLTADGEPFEVTPAALKHWTDTFKTVQGAGRSRSPFPRAPISRSTASTTAATSSA